MHRLSGLTRPFPLVQDAELAYNSLLDQMRKYSLIVVGDYRTVTFKAF